MKIIHFIESISVDYGGPAKSLPYFSKSLSEEGLENEIWSISKGDTLDNDLVLKLGLRLRLFKKSNYTKYFSCTALFGLYKSFGEKGVIYHFHSIWSPVSFISILLCFIAKKKYVISPRSSLIPKSLQKRKVLKIILGSLFLKRLVKNSEFVHCTDIVESDGVKEFCEVKTIVVPHGLDLNDEMDVETGSISSVYTRYSLSTDLKYLVFYSRIHPRKNLDLILDVLASSEVLASYGLIVAGPTSDEAYLNLVQDKVKTVGVGSRVYFVGSLNAFDTNEIFSISEAFVLFSEFENYGMSIAEALNFGLFCVISDCTPWKNLDEFDAGYICSSFDEYDLLHGLERVAYRRAKNRSQQRMFCHNYLSENVMSWQSVAVIFKSEYEAL